MKGRPRRGRREASALVERAELALRETQKLCEQREAQLKNLQRFLGQNPGIAHGKRFEWLKY
jgi:hypothetical protein